MPFSRRQAAFSKEPRTDSVHAGPQLSRRASQTNTLPPQLQQSVPSCARPCLSSYIIQDYDCPDDDFACLCQRYSSHGYTLGELGAICIKQACPDGIPKGAAYHICKSVPEAVAATHTVLTVPNRPATRTTPSTTTPTTQTTTEAHNTQTSPPQTNATKMSARPTSSESQIRQTKSDSSTMSPTPSAGAGTLSSTTGVPQAGAHQMPSTNLTHGQAVGVSIAAMAAVMLAIGAIYLIMYLRRRRVKTKDDRNSYDFVDEAPPRFSPFNYGYADPRGPLGGFEKRRAELGSGKHMTRGPGMRVSYDDYAAKYNEKSVSISPPSQRSDKSMKGSSNQLPEKPAPIVTRGLSKASVPTPNTAGTATTVFEEDKTPTPAIPRKPLPKLPPAGTAIHYPPPPPGKPRKTHNASSQAQSPGRAHQPSLSLQIPRQATRAAQLTAFPLPPASAPRGQNLPPPPPGPPPALVDSARNSDTSVLDYYTSPDPGYAVPAYDTSPDIDLPTPVQIEARRRRAAPPMLTVTKPTHLPPPPRPFKRQSTASDTSFESMNTDEPTPPEEEPKDLEVKQLTPVLESPLAGVRYPKVPRSSNQSVPRSPKVLPFGPLSASPALLPKTQAKVTDHRTQLPSHVPQPQSMPYPPKTPDRKHTSASSALSGTTLAAKRRGDGAAQNLERNFYVADSAHSRVGSQATTSRSSNQSGQLYSGNSAQSLSTQTTVSPLKGYGRVAAAGRIRPAAAPATMGLGLGGIIAQSSPSLGNGQVQKPVYPGLPRHSKVLVDDAAKVAARRHSPQWEPKLTPSRRGEDLFLSVGVATPRRDVFRM